MSLRKRATKNTEYWIFTGGRGNEIHLGPVNDYSKIKSEKVFKALSYLKERHVHYSNIEDKLVSMLSSKEKDKYLSKRIPEFIKLTNKSISSLSDPELQKKYEEIFKERKIAEDQTRDRQVQKQAKQITDQMSSENLKLRKAFATKLVDITKKFGSDQQDVLSSLISDKKTCIQIYTFYQKNHISKIHVAIDNLYRDLLTSNNGVQQNHV